MTNNVRKLQKSWSILEPLLAIQTEADYLRSVKQLNNLIDVIGTPEIGSQGVVSEVLSGKQDLNLRQIQALSQRFHVSPAVFI